MADTPGSTLASVEIVLEGYSVTGNCRGLSEHLRLIDLFNNPEITHLQLADVKVHHFLNALEIVAGAGPIFIDKQSVILGRSLASPEEEERRNAAHSLDFVQKEKQLMVVFAPPFRIRGNVHMISEADLTIALPKLFEGFLAMTEVSTVHEVLGGSKWDDQFLVVNGRRMKMLCLLPESWRDPAITDVTAAAEEGRAATAA
jgi:hypothetical protein